MADRLVGVPAFSPLSQSTPFSYRDLDTHLTILKKLGDKVNEIVDTSNDNNAAIADETQRLITDLVTSVNTALDYLRRDVEQWIAGSHDESIAFNPTNGLQEDVSQVVSDTFDNSRIFAYFAGDYDALGLTSAQYDALGYEARHYDLAPLYPTLNDVYTPPTV